jgi:hypothetical protein
MQAKGEQLKMFMTPSEIHAGYQPLDADREMSGDYDRASYSGSKPWTKGEGFHEINRATHPGGPQRRNWVERTEGGGKLTEATETDEELWGRKLEEAQSYGTRTPGGSGVRNIGQQSSHWSGGSYEPGHETTGGGWASSRESTERYHPGTEGMTLHESIGQTGVQSPVRLGSEVGSMGKPQVVGGHHRLASATEHEAWGGMKGEQFIPVLHHESIQEARSQPTQAAFKYT